MSGYNNHVIGYKFAFRPQAIFETVQQCGKLLQEHGVSATQTIRILLVVTLLRMQHACGKDPSNYHVLLRIEHLSDVLVSVNVEIRNDRTDFRQFNVNIPRGQAVDILPENDLVGAFADQLEISAGAEWVMAELSKEEVTVYE
jgi:hypothetical protein